MSQSLPHRHPAEAPADRPNGDVRVFFYLLSLYFLIIIPILRANRYFNDDLKRALIGRTGWDSNGRPLTTLLMKLLQSYDRALVDISPLTQIGAIAVLAWVGVLIARRYAIRSPWMAALVAFPLGAQPFFLENLSYKFDALSMGLAIYFALLPIVALKDHRRGWWWGVLAIFASLNFYQPAINVYLIFVLLDLVVSQLHGMTPRLLLRQFLSRALQAGVSMLVYQLIVGIHINGWVKIKSEKIHGFHDLPVLKTNLVDFYTYVAKCFNEQWWMYFGPVLVLLAFFPVAIGLRYMARVRSTHPVWVGPTLLVTSFLLPLAVLVCVPGPMLLLLRPETEPRVFMGVGAVLVAGLIVMQAAMAQWRRSDKWAMAVACMLALGMCSFASAYGNALGEQKNYEDRIGARLADDLADFRTSHGIHTYLLDGSAGYSPITSHVIEQFPLVRWLIQPYIDGDETFLTPYFLMYYVSDIADMRFRADDAAMQRVSGVLTKACPLPVIRSTQAYDVRLVDDIAVVSFRSASARCSTGNARVDASGESGAK
ncbi:glucosyltransferase GtrII-like protein [Luteibacter rhizovicinus]|uniref:Glucosyltransferase GtrII-like protein n=1 Tax=Luteibacter rhizovicinus TaxID=242606 RepID=A0A4R3YM55_9GAMM|nr:glucosyltransferase domain-containing protein [Luteibacter rhizovicinus]TCV93386.1 glucosyltransferase GtrII-like protein [Luteibacter rhizovicinus]